MQEDIESNSPVSLTIRNSRYRYYACLSSTLFLKKVSLILHQRRKQTELRQKQRHLPQNQFKVTTLNLWTHPSLPWEARRAWHLRLSATVRVTQSHAWTLGRSANIPTSRLLTGLPGHADKIGILGKTFTLQLQRDVPDYDTSVCLTRLLSVCCTK